MKAARLVVLSVALAAGGAAALLVGGGSDKKPAPPPVATLDTVDVLIAKSDIGIGTAVTTGDFQWQAWPAASTGSNHILRKERPNAIEELAGSITRVPFSAGEPIRDGKLIKANGSGFMAAILPPGMRAETPAYTAKRNVALDKWRKGESPHTHYPDPNKGTTNELSK
jgi:pilus assembly protein CpaB